MIRLRRGYGGQAKDQGLMTNILRPPGRVEGQVPKRMMVAGETAAGAEEQADVFREVEVAADIGGGEAAVGIRVGALAKNLGAEREMRGPKSRCISQPPKP